jgi:hypothetical protein
MRPKSKNPLSEKIALRLTASQFDAAHEHIDAIIRDRCVSEPEKHHTKSDVVREALLDGLVVLGRKAAKARILKEMDE